MPVLLHQRVGIVAESKAKQLPVFVGPSAQVTGREIVALRPHAQDRSNGWFFADLHMRYHLVRRRTRDVWQYSFNQ
jgi:hypothetical protein